MSTTTRTQPTHHQQHAGDNTHHKPNTPSQPSQLSQREHKALTNAMLVLPNHFRAKNVPGFYEVVTTGDPYLVDLYQEVCECPDYQYRETTCKHIHRVKYATGDKPIPQHLEHDIDPALGALTNTE